MTENQPVDGSNKAITSFLVGSETEKIQGTIACDRALYCLTPTEQLQLALARPVKDQAELKTVLKWRRDLVRSRTAKTEVLCEVKRIALIVA